MMKPTDHAWQKETIGGSLCWVCPHCEAFGGFVLDSQGPATPPIWCDDFSLALTDDCKESNQRVIDHLTGKYLYDLSIGECAYCGTAHARHYIMECRSDSSPYADCDNCGHPRRDHGDEGRCLFGPDTKFAVKRHYTVKDSV